MALRRLARKLPTAVLTALVSLRHGDAAIQRLVVGSLRRTSVKFGRASGTGSVAIGSVITPVRVDPASSFDAAEIVARHRRTVAGVLHAAGIPHVMLPAKSEERSRLVVALPDRERVLELLPTVTELAGWWAQPRCSGRDAPDRSHPVAELHSRRQLDMVTVYTYVAAQTGELLSGCELGVDIEFWEQVQTDRIPRVDGETFAAGTVVAPTVNWAVPYLSPQRWEAAQVSPLHWPDAQLPHIFDVTDPIDIVYTWVDGSDPAWRERKHEALRHVSADEHNMTALADSRFVSRGELRYSLRSVEMYASWARHIYVVTDGQVPSWLRTDHPKLTVVDHKDIFTDPTALPVFNSHAIESQLHHIPGLSERYLYLNDDVFLGRITHPGLFFHANGLSKFFLSTALLDIDDPSWRDLPVLSAAKHNREFIERHFGVSLTNKFKHTPHPQQRRVLVELEERYPAIFDRVMRSKFRHPDDLSLAASLHHYYAYCRGLAVPADLRYVYQDLAAPDTRFRLRRLAARRDCDTFCLNDTFSTYEQIEYQMGLVEQFFNRYYPVPSSFEK